MKIGVVCIALLLVASQVGAQQWTNDDNCWYTKASSKFSSWGYSGRALAKLTYVAKNADCCYQCRITSGCNKFTQQNFKFGSSLCTLYRKSAKLKRVGQGSGGVITAGKVS
ncbi:hypothetical protein Ndes2526B_g01158 [Nannochloris sp. 'desiccata']